MLIYCLLSAFYLPGIEYAAWQAGVTKLRPVSQIWSRFCKVLLEHSHTQCL